MPAPARRPACRAVSTRAAMPGALQHGASPAAFMSRAAPRDARDRRLPTSFWSARRVATASSTTARRAIEQNGMLLPPIWQRCSMPEAPPYVRDGAEIYRRSFAIIRAEADLGRFSALEERVAVRIIHACGMPEVARDIALSEGFAENARGALLK